MHMLGSSRLPHPHFGMGPWRLAAGTVVILCGCGDSLQSNSRHPASTLPNSGDLLVARDANRHLPATTISELQRSRGGSSPNNRELEMTADFKIANPGN